MKKRHIAVSLVVGLMLIGCSSSNPTPSSSNQNTNTTQNNTSLLSENEVKSIALKHANLSEDQVTWYSCYTDRDDGIQTYECRFGNEDAEYEYEINGETGDILQYDINYHASSSNNETYIGEDKAKEIVLNHAGFTQDQVQFTHFELDKSYHHTEYEIEFINQNIEYEYSLDAVSGEILSYQQDRND